MDRHSRQPVAQFWNRLIREFETKALGHRAECQRIADEERAAYDRNLGPLRQQYPRRNNFDQLLPPPRSVEQIRQARIDSLKAAILTRLQQKGNPFATCREAIQDAVAATFAQSRIEGFSQKTILVQNGRENGPEISKVLSGRNRNQNIEPFLAEYFSDLTTLKEIQKAYEFTPQVDELTMWQPRIGVLKWMPFCDEERGFLRQVAKRFFQLSGHEKHRFEHKGFEALLNGKERIELSLALAETLHRTGTAKTLHTPVVMGLNLIGRFNLATFERLRKILLKLEASESVERIRLLTTPLEIADEYLTSLPNSERYFQLETATSAPVDSERQLSDTAWDAIAQGAFYSADELTCLHLLQEGSDRGIKDLGLVLPLGTKQIVRNQEYARLPGHKVSLFSIPYYQHVICDFLQEAMRVYLENEVESTAALYKNLYDDLSRQAFDSLLKLNDGAHRYLESVHTTMGDEFYPGVNTREVIAERWARNTLRLYAEFLDQPLNLPWRPVLVRALELCGPIRNQYRTPGERRAVLSYRELPPIIIRGAKHETDYSIFGALLGPLRPHVVLDETVARYNRDDAQSQLGPETTAAVAIGFFAVSSRLFDWQFFRMPVRLRFSAVAFGEFSESQRNEVRALLSVLDNGQHAAFDKFTIRVLLLKHGAAHNLLRDHGLSEDSAILVNDSEIDRSDAFLEKIKALQGPAVVIADELSCLEVFATAGQGELIGHGLVQKGLNPDSSRGVYFSVAIRRSAPDWIQFFERAVPLTLDTYREALGAAQANLFRKLTDWTRSCAQPLHLPIDHIERWCRGVLTLDDPDSDLLPGWRPVIALARKRIETDTSSADA